MLCHAMLPHGTTTTSRQELIVIVTPWQKLSRNQYDSILISFLGPHLCTIYMQIS